MLYFTFMIRYIIHRMGRDGLMLRYYRGSVRVQSTGRAGDGDTGHGEEGQWHNGASRHGDQRPM